MVFGPPLAGKRTLVHALARAKHGRLEVFPSSASNSPADLADLCLKCTFEDGDLMVVAATFSGSVWHRDAWVPEMTEADGILVVLSSEPQHIWSAREHLRWFRQNVEVQPSRVAGVLSKSDLGLSSAESAGLLSELPVDAVFATSVADLPSLIRPFEWIVEEVLVGRRGHCESDHENRWFGDHDT